MNVTYPSLYVKREWHFVLKWLLPPEIGLILAKQGCCMQFLTALGHGFDHVYKCKC